PTGRKAHLEAKTAPAPKEEAAKPEAAKAQAAAAATDAPTGPVFRAPMGGTVMEIKVKPGQKIKAGDLVMVYEAMKMENDLASDMGGTVKRILVNEGDVMATDQALIEFE
ncbi:MAG: acetyl-CoA carboxylase biotin carboxyl carrier protein subunit, partial [Muribaculaceae bacterium]|nr:acetyl-CoA carboxylase biotin carboxyl carrier protein subunit [Muribaculaceae bacterium]